MYTLLLKIFALISIGGSILGILLAEVPPEQIRQDPSRYQSLLTGRQILYAILGYAAFFTFGLLLAGLMRLIEGGPSTYWYRMNNEFIELQPSGRGSGVTFFKDVKHVEEYQDKNEIRLITRWGKCPVLVRPEDYALIKDHILAHI